MLAIVLEEPETPKQQEHGDHRHSLIDDVGGLVQTSAGLLGQYRGCGGGMHHGSAFLMFFNKGYVWLRASVPDLYN